jgi:hypothetical protein
MEEVSQINNFLMIIGIKVQMGRQLPYKDGTIINSIQTRAMGRQEITKHQLNEIHIRIMTWRKSDVKLLGEHISIMDNLSSHIRLQRHNLGGRVSMKEERVCMENWMAHFPLIRVEEWMKKHGSMVTKDMITTIEILSLHQYKIIIDHVELHGEKR